MKKKLSITPGSENSASSSFNHQGRFAEFLLPGTPKKSLGQNFLVNPKILDRIVSAAEITENDIILEVGPGTGNLTEKLSERAAQVIAVEKDSRLIELLQKKFENTNVEIAESDILKFDCTKYEIQDAKYKIVGNIPYYITSRFLRTVFDPNSRTSQGEVRYGARKWPKPKLIVLTIQKEVAQRIIAKPPYMNLLAVSIQYFSESEIIGYISKENFRPRPKVDSAIIRLNPKPEILNSKQGKEFFKIVRAGFSQKRKMLASNLEKNGFEKNKIAVAFKKLGINPKSRAENLELDDWIKLTEILTI